MLGMLNATFKDLKPKKALSQFGGEIKARVGARDMKLVFAVSVALIIIGFGSALDDPALSFYGEPQYAIKALTSDTTLDQGSKFRMELYITGAGDVNLSRIFVSIPKYIVNNGKVKLTELKYIPIDPGNGTYRGKPEINDSMNSSFYLPVDPILYQLPAERGEIFSPKMLILGEASYLVNETYYAPFTVDFVIAKNATGGDREIYINYIYKYINKWYQDTKIIRVHINHWYETDSWIRKLQWGAMIGIGLSLLLLIRDFLLRPLIYLWRLVWG